MDELNGSFFNTFQLVFHIHTAHHVQFWKHLDKVQVDSQLDRVQVFPRVGQLEQCDPKQDAFSVFTRNQRGLVRPRYHMYVTN